MIKLHDFNIFSQSLALIIGALVSLLGAISNWRKNKHHEEKEAIEDYKQLYQEMKNRCDKLQQENDELRKELNNHDE